MGYPWKSLSAVAVETIAAHRSAIKEVPDGENIYLDMLEIDIEESFGGFTW